MLPENETELSARTIHSTVQKLASRVSTWNTFAPVTQFRIHPEILAGCTKRKQPEKGETGRERERIFKNHQPNDKPRRRIGWWPTLITL